MWLSPRSLHNRVGYNLPQDNFHLMFPWFLQQITKCQDFSWCTWLSEDPKNWLCTCPYFFLLCEYYSYQMREWKLFLKLFLEDITSFYAATDTPVLDFWWHLLQVSKPVWAALFMLGRGICVTCSPRFISGVTPTDLLAASLAYKLFSSTYLWVSIVGLKTRICHATTAWQCETKEMFPTELWLGNGNLQYTHMNCS